MASKHGPKTLIKKTQSIRNKLIAAFCLTIIPMVFLGIVSYLIASQTVKDIVRVNVQSTIESTQKYLELIFESIDDTSRELLTDSQIQNFYDTKNIEDIADYALRRKAAASRIANALYSNRYIANIAIVSDNNKSINTFEKLSSFDLKDAETTTFYQKAVEMNGQMLWIGAHKELDEAYGLDRSNYSLSAVRLLRSSYTSKILGLLIIDIKPQYVDDFLMDINISSEGEIHLISPDGRDIRTKLRGNDAESNTSIGEEEPASDLLNQNFYRSILASKADIGFFEIDYQFVNYMLSYAKVGTTGYFLIGLIPVSELTSGANAIRSWTICLVLVSTSISIMIGLLIATGIGKKVTAIIEAMNSAISSNLLYRIPEKEHDDEFKIIAAHFNMMCDNLKEYINIAYAYKLKQRTAELKFLEAQVNPHFLYNTLEAIRSHLDIADNEDDAEKIYALAVLYRMSVKTDSVISISEELELVRMYLRIFNTRYNENLKVEMLIDDDVMRYGIIKLLLQPIIENYIVHSYDVNRDNNCLVIRGKLRGNDVLFEVIDNGKGIQEEKLYEIRHSIENRKISSKNKIGLINVSERIKLLFGNDYGLQIESKINEGTKVTVTIPAKTKEDMENMISHMTGENFDHV